MSKKPPTVKDRAALDAAKLRLRDYLIANGFDPSKNMHCIFHSPDTDPSMSLLPDGQAVHCFGCGITADIVNVIAQLEGFAPNSKEAIKRAIEFAGTAPVQSSVQSVERKKKGTDPQKHNWTSALKSKPCVAYLHSRGFSGDDNNSIDKYNVAFDKANNCLIIPHDGDYYTARAIDQSVPPHRQPARPPSQPHSTRSHSSVAECRPLPRAERKRNQSSSML